MWSYLRIDADLATQIDQIGGGGDNLAGRVGAYGLEVFGDYGLDLFERLHYRIQ